MLSHPQFLSYTKRLGGVLQVVPEGVGIVRVILATGLAVVFLDQQKN